MTTAPPPEEPGTGPPRRVSITGSCVSRDTIEAAGSQLFSVTTYVARQSLASCGSDASAHYPVGARVASAFQERMLRGDFAGDLGDRLAAAAAGTDLVLWDIVDERLGIHVLPDGSVITRSVDVLAVPEIRDVLGRGRHVPFGSAEHYALWADGAIRLIARLEETGLLARTVVLQVPWAGTTVEGRPSPLSLGTSAEEANRLSRPYYARLRDLGLSVLEVDESHVRSDPSHRWGLAPFHYAPAVYEEIITRLG